MPPKVLCPKSLIKCCYAKKGRIANRFSKDMTNVDEELSSILYEAHQVGFISKV